MPSLHPQGPSDPRPCDQPPGLASWAAACASPRVSLCRLLAALGGSETLCGLWTPPLPLCPACPSSPGPSSACSASTPLAPTVAAGIAQPGVLLSNCGQAAAILGWTPCSWSSRAPLGLFRGLLEAPCSHSVHLHRCWAGPFVLERSPPIFPKTLLDPSDPSRHCFSLPPSSSLLLLASTLSRSQ